MSGEGPRSHELDETPSFADEIELTEKFRVYDYGAHQVELRNVIGLVIRDSGNHRVKTADGLLHILAPGWFAIHIDDGGNDWTL